MQVKFDFAGGSHTFYTQDAVHVNLAVSDSLSKLIEIRRLQETAGRVELGVCCV